MKDTNIEGMGEISPLLTAAAVLRINLGLMPRNHLEAHNHPQPQCQGADALFWPLRGPGTRVVHIHLGKHPGTQNKSKQLKTKHVLLLKAFLDVPVHFQTRILSGYR